MEQSTSLEANSRSAEQDIRHLLRSPKVHYRSYMGPATGHYPQLDEYSTHPYTLFP